jgi:hypothetical protein
MMKPGPMLGAVVAVLAVSLTPGISQQPSQVPAREGPTLILAGKVPLTGVAGRIDHFTFDPKRRLTIFSGLGNNTIEIVNNFQGRHVKTIMGLDEPQGPLYVPEFDKLFVANAGNGGTFARAFRWATNQIPIIFGMKMQQNGFLSAS